jgi:hypothetical protein
MTLRAAGLALSHSMQAESCDREWAVASRARRRSILAEAGLLELARSGSDACAARHSKTA